MKNMTLDFPELFGNVPPNEGKTTPKSPDTVTADKWVQENIKRSNGLISELLRGIKSGEDKTKLLLLALRIISLMHGESVTYKIAREYLISDRKDDKA